MPRFITIRGAGGDLHTQAHREALAGYTPMAICLLAGAIAGALLTFSPVLLIAANTALQFILGHINGTGNDWGMMSSQRLFERFLRGVIPFAIGSAAGGAGLAYLRRLSIRKELYLRLAMGRGAEAQFGLNTGVAMVAIPVLFVYALNVTGYTIIFYFMGIGALLLGLIYDGLWEGLDNAVLRLIGRTDPGCVRALEIKELLRIDEDLGQFVPRSVTVDWAEQLAYVEGEYDDPKVEKRIRELLLSRVIGLKRVIVRPYGGAAGESPSLAGGEAERAALAQRRFRVELRPRIAR